MQRFFPLCRHARRSTFSGSFRRNLNHLEYLPMFFVAPAFLAGVLLFYFEKNMPSVYVAVMAAAAFCLLCFFARKKYRIPVACYALPMGYLWALAAAYPLLVHPLSTESEGKKINVCGYILSLPEDTPFGSRFIF